MKINSEKEKSLRTELLILKYVLYGLLGVVVGAAGLSVLNWEIWTILFLTGIIDVVAYLRGKLSE